MRASRLARLAAACALALGPLALDAFAGDQSKRLPNDVEVRMWSRWPSQLHKGWAPIFVEVRNESGSEKAIKLRADSTDWRGRRQVVCEFVLEAGGSRSIELLAPVDVLNSSDYLVNVEAGGERLWLNGIVGKSGVDPSQRAVLLVTEREFEAGELERWNAGVADAAGHVDLASHFGVLGAPVRRKSAGAGTTPASVEIALARRGELARQTAAYSSLDLVVLDAQAQWPSESDAAGLAAWLRSGGELAVIGANAERAARALGALDEWMQPRFEFTDATVGGAGYRCGLGRLWIERASSLDEDGDGEIATLEERRFALLGSILSGRKSTAPSAAGWRGDKVPAALELETLPHRTFAVLLIAFALLIGPLNFWFVARRKRPVLLLVTIPVISVAVTLLLLVYGVLFQGLDVKTASWSTTVLDQRTHRSSTLELRHLFAGLAPASGLRPGAGTVVCDAGVSTGLYRDRGLTFNARYDGGLLLSGDYLPTRRRVIQALSADRAERARLEVEFSDGRAQVQNNLGADVLALIVRDESGAAFASEKRLAVGERATLERVGDEAALEHQTKYLTNAMPLTAIQDDYRLPAACYLAQLDRGAFLDDCGVECNELEGYHVVLGVLGVEAEARR
jgi:hypothetical protein